MLSNMLSVQTVNAAVVGDVVSPANRSAAFGFMLSAFAIAAVVGPLSSLMFPNRVGSIAFALATGVLAAFLYLLLPETAPIVVARRQQSKYT